MAYLGGLDGEEREMLHNLVVHFVNALNDERAKNMKLTNEVATMRERIQVLEAAAYGLF